VVIGPPLLRLLAAPALDGRGGVLGGQQRVFLAVLAARSAAPSLPIFSRKHCLLAVVI